MLPYTEQRTINGTVNLVYRHAFLDLLKGKTSYLLSGMTKIISFSFLAESKYTGLYSTFPVSVWEQLHSSDFYNRPTTILGVLRRTVLFVCFVLFLFSVNIMTRFIYGIQ